MSGPADDADLAATRHRGLRLLRRLRPIQDRSADGGPSPTLHSGHGRTGEDRDGSRVHCDSLDEGGAKLCPCGIATGSARRWIFRSRAASKVARLRP